ncbi:lantibiotic dehydratase [Pedobacter sp. Leaf194]|uniref:lantibiotic dehydratase n=1 Tax=Pedobacter sp. Leaf194 TaxID=1736297 RepID=UPI0007029214|nr:lantibiotic dehydratase [Pedobacter sp. Leaf194]KQS41526.1 hypothetical protein ASG14_03410 [Pedobacter sp. Leaf194]
MKVAIHQDVIFRTPRFSYQSELADCWEALKASIAISSDTFYQTIKDVQAAELEKLNSKVLFTIWKYYNRAKFRSTPYGTFAGFTMLKSALSSTENKITIEEKQTVHEFIDWPFRNSLKFSIAELLGNNCMLFANSSYYFTNGSIRYIACTDGLFELAEVDTDEFVVQILQICSKPVSVNDLIVRLGIEAARKDEVLSLLEDMLSLQLLLSDTDPNIIGEDYFKRINVKSAHDTPKYLISERKALSGGLDERMFHAVPGLINMMQRILPVDGRDALKQFVNKFQRKFEQKEIPLSVALDPEMGVGYDELEQAGLGDDFIAQFHGKQSRKPEDLTDKLKQDFKKLIHHESFSSRDTIRLEQLGLSLSDKPATIPNSFSILMSVADDMICVDQTGGSTANALSGRFTIANDNVFQHCKNIGQIEKAANPDVLFFDVAYMVETNVDNINRRKLVYERQLSILNFDTSENPLTLDDIMISVYAGEVILRSRKLNRRIIPRMASAYNYSRSDLSVFRLLCDLQHQNIQTNLTLFLENLYPELPYYPRLQYQNIVLAQQKWQVKKADVSFLSLHELRVFLNQLGVSNYFKAGLSDQTLCFDKNADLDMTAFIQYMQKQDKVYLEEVIVPDKSVVVDEEGKPYFAQFILNIYHQDKIYNGYSKLEIHESVVKQVFAPGTEWLYFEIYCHQQRSDSLLGGPIAHFLNAYQSHIKSWFFIRYNENGYHLRLRILLVDASRGQELTAAFSSYLEEDLAAGLVSDLQLRTYKRETQRYGNELIERVEEHFSVDSQFVLSLFETNPDALSRYSYCAALIENIQKAAIFDNKELAETIKMMSDSFNLEHNLEPADFKKINAQYQVYRKWAYVELNEMQLAKLTLFSNSFANILKLCSAGRKVQLFSDLLHMHVNRLFNKDQRTHEMVIYYFLLKDVQRRNAMG